MKEADLKIEVKNFLRAVGPACWFFMPVPTGYGVRGIPDFIGCRGGRFFAIETKSDQGELTPWQDRCIKEIKAAGGIAGVARSMGDVYALFGKT